MNLKWSLRIGYLSVVVPGYLGYLLVVARLFDVFKVTYATICIALIGFAALEYFYIGPMLRLSAKITTDRYKSHS